MGQPHHYEASMRANNPHWPLPKASTERAIRDEMKNARKHFPDNNGILKALQFEVENLPHKMIANDAGMNTNAIDIYMHAIRIAVLAIRICEEGDDEHKYAEYILRGQNVLEVKPNHDK